MVRRTHKGEGVRGRKLPPRSKGGQRALPECLRGSKLPPRAIRGDYSPLRSEPDTVRRRPRFERASDPWGFESHPLRHETPFWCALRGSLLHTTVTLTGPGTVFCKHLANAEGTPGCELDQPNPTEELFDRYLKERGYDFEVIPATEQPTADRLVHTPIGDVVVEVEGFEFTAADRRLTQLEHFSGSGLLGRARLEDALRRARRQLDRTEYAKSPCLVVLGQHPYIIMDDMAILTSMYGDAFIRIPVGPEGPAGEAQGPFFSMRGRVRNPGGPISAVAVIEEVCPDRPAFDRLLHEEYQKSKREKGNRESKEGMAHFLELAEHFAETHPELNLQKRVPRVRVYENFLAGRPMPRTVFWSAVDHRWGEHERAYMELERPKDAS